MELIEQLVKSLGISEDQAKGGAGLLFKAAKDKLGDIDFSRIAAAVPGMADLLKAAPSSDRGGGGLMGGLSSLAGGALGKLGDGALGKLGGLAGLAGGFSKLGLDGDMVGKFVPIITDFVKSKGGAGVTDLLAKVFK